MHRAYRDFCMAVFLGLVCRCDTALGYHTRPPFKRAVFVQFESKHGDQLFRIGPGRHLSLKMRPHLPGNGRDDVCLGAVADLGCRNSGFRA